MHQKLIYVQWALRFHAEFFFISNKANGKVLKLAAIGVNNVLKTTSHSNAPAII